MIKTFLSLTILLLLSQGLSLAQTVTSPYDIPETIDCNRGSYQSGSVCVPYTLQEVPYEQRLLIIFLIGGAVDSISKSDLSTSDAIDRLEGQRDSLGLDPMKPAEKFAIDVFDMFIEQMDQNTKSTAK